MHPVDCPAWEYSQNPNKSLLLKDAIKAILIGLRNGKIDAINRVTDTRPIHRHLFDSLVPVGYPYFAGCYRGENYRCLKYYRVQVRSDPRVGYPPHRVIGSMDELAQIVQESISALDEGMQLPDSQVPTRDKLGYIVAVACRIFELFLRIHPYANGNGHTARFCIWAILGRYDFWPYKWPIDPRPPDPPYTSLIVAYRNGDQVPLESFILQSLVSN